MEQRQGTEGITTVAKKRKLIRKRMCPIGSSILPKISNGKRIDGRSAAGRRLKAIAYQLAEQTPDSDTPLIRSRILVAAALRVEAERMAWEIGQGHAIDTEALRKTEEAADRAERRLQGFGLHVGHPKANGERADPEGSRSRSLGKRLVKANGITAEKYLP